MLTAQEELVRAWRLFYKTKLREKQRPYILKGDEGVLQPKRYLNYRNYHECLKNIDHVYKQASKFHLGLLPMPYSGNLQKAYIYLLNLNPGFSPGDFYEEATSKKLIEEKIRELTQINLLS